MISESSDDSTCLEITLGADHPFDIVARQRELEGGLLVAAPKLSGDAQHLGLGHRIDERIGGRRNDVLTEHHRDPTRNVEQFIILSEHAAVLPEQLEFVLEGIRKIHRPDMVPERLRPPRGMIVENKEVTNWIITADDCSVELVAFDGADPVPRKQSEQLLH